MQLAPLICVQDVEASSRWCQQLLGCSSGHGNWELWLKDPDGYAVVLTSPLPL